MLITRVTVQWNEERDRLLMQEMGSCGIFQHNSASRERGQFWQQFATNSNYQDISLILGTCWD